MLTYLPLRNDKSNYEQTIIVEWRIKLLKSRESLFNRRYGSLVPWLRYWLKYGIGSLASYAFLRIAALLLPLSIVNAAKT